MFLWIPFRLYYNLSVKPLIFGQDTFISNFDGLFYSIMASLLIITIILQFKVKQYFLALMTVVGVFIIVLLSLGSLNTLINYSFGLNTVHEATWILYPILMLFILFVWGQILENWQS
jgi:hypothetical protein